MNSENACLESVPTSGQVAVELWAARIPSVRWIAEHTWLLVIREEQMDRWEVWQHRDQGGTSWGYLHQNLNAPHAGIRRCQAYQVASFRKQQAQEIVARIEASPDNYPWSDKYWLVPGPNSNTFVQWALGSTHALGWRSIGRGFARRASA
ncbi:MAG: DUF3750 domain-containing protein [Planctomycetota bacterium]